MKINGIKINIPIELTINGKLNPPMPNKNDPKAYANKLPTVDPVVK